MGIKMQELKDRLKYARKNANITQAEIAKNIGITQASYSEIERGLVKSSGKIVELAQILKVNPHWLATGQGEMTDIQFNNAHIENTQIDTSLINQAIAITNLDKDKTIETALQFFITMHAQESIRALRGKLTWEGDLVEMRSAVEN